MIVYKYVRNKFFKNEKETHYEEKDNCSFDLVYRALR